MTNYSEDIATDIATTSFTPARTKNSSPGKVIAFTIVKKKVPKARPFKSQEIKVPYEKWSMPPQPEGYLKCRENDFL